MLTPGYASTAGCSGRLKVSMMKIVRLTSSHAWAGGSNETRETTRSETTQAKGAKLLDGKGASPNPARGELVSASLNLNRRPTSQERRSLPSAGKQRIPAPVGPVGVRGGSACRKNNHDRWETRAGSRSKRRSVEEIHNLQRSPARESEGLVVAMKRGNARGAKEPCCIHATINEERAA